VRRATVSHRRVASGFGVDRNDTPPFVSISAGILSSTTVTPAAFNLAGAS
jgi:hypothetical protein